MELLAWLPIENRTAFSWSMSLLWHSGVGFKITIISLLYAFFPFKECSRFHTVIVFTISVGHLPIYSTIVLSRSLFHSVFFLFIFLQNTGEQHKFWQSKVALFVKYSCQNQSIITKRFSINLFFIDWFWLRNKRTFCKSNTKSLVFHLLIYGLILVRLSALILKQSLYNYTCRCTAAEGIELLIITILSRVLAAAQSCATWGVSFFVWTRCCIMLCVVPLQHRSWLFSCLSSSWATTLDRLLGKEH